MHAPTRVSLMTKTATVAAAAICAIGASGVAPAGAAAPGLPSCAGAALRVALTSGEGGDNHDSFVIEYKNETRRTCTLRGYPGLDAVTRHGHVLRHAKRSLAGYFGGAPHGARTVVLATGGHASATVEFLNSDHAGHVCAFAHHVATTPPNTDRIVHRMHRLSLCYLRVHPVVAGTTGRE